MKRVFAILMMAANAYGQTVINPWDVPCDAERVKVNLEVKLKQHLSGELTDQSGARFELSKVEIRKSGRKGKFVAYKTVTTDKMGRFDFGLIDPGKYRFLPSPNRAFKQPANLNCFEGPECELKLTLEVNPTDQAFAGCPIQ